jgi:NACHT domain
MEIDLQMKVSKTSGYTHQTLKLSENLLNRLPYAIEAPFNFYERQHESACLPDTRVDLLQEIYNWADRQDERCLFWLNGLAGTGKSTVARTVARCYYDKARLGASFFFFRGGGDVSHAGKFVTSIALQLASNIPGLYQHICDAITECYDIATRSLRDQWHQLILRPMTKLDDNGQSTYILVVDALDECDDDNNVRTIIHLLAEIRRLEKVRLRVFLTSRPEVPIRHGFYQIPEAEHQAFILHNISPSIVDHDITTYLEYNLTIIRQERGLNSDWPGNEAITTMVQRANGLFIWAATTCRFIREGKRFAAKRLNQILIEGSNTVTAPEEHLNEIYTTVLKHSVASEYTDEEKEESYGMLKLVLGSIVVLLSPLSVSSLGRLLGVAKDDVELTVVDLHSVLDVPQVSARPLRLYHPSFRGFLLDSNKCTDSNFWVDGKHAHLVLAKSCIRLMSNSLKQDVFNLGNPGILLDEVEKSQIDQIIPPEVQYACLYWIQHVHEGNYPLQDDDEVHQFLQNHLLHWLEALGWIGKVTEGIYAISLLDSLVAVSQTAI